MSEKSILLFIAVHIVLYPIIYPIVKSYIGDDEDDK